MQRPTNKVEKRLTKNGFKVIVGIDEAGRGAWAGPLVAAAAVFDPKFTSKQIKNLNIRDSKALSESQREKIFKLIRKNFIWAVGLASEKEIDQHGLTWANQQAVFRSLGNLNLTPDYLLIDQINGFSHSLPHELHINGDKNVSIISMASILAKVSRDRLMIKYHKLYPQFKFHQNKGYGTKFHLNSLKKQGPCKLHRLSFAPLKQNNLKSS